MEAVRDRLDCVTVEGVELWCDPDAPPVGPSAEALLLPLYDELTLSYPLINFPQTDGHPHAPGEDLFVGSVIIAEANVGTWRRTVRGRKMIMEIALAPGIVTRSRRAGRGRSEQAGDLRWKAAGADDHRLNLSASDEAASRAPREQRQKKEGAGRVGVQIQARRSS